MPTQFFSYFILLINYELNRRVNKKIFLSLVMLNTPFLNRPVISLRNTANYSSYNKIIRVKISLSF